MVAISDSSSTVSDESYMAQEIPRLPRPSSSNELVLAERMAPPPLPRRANSVPSGMDMLAVETESEASSGGMPLTWRLVWCHERCHKQESEARRRALGDAAHEAGASLVCLKKAAKFSMWLKNAQRPPFVLLTDWREVKPCMHAASQVHVSNQPAFTVVLCEEPRHYERASAWAQSLPPRNDPVHVCRDLALAKSFLADLAGRFTANVAQPLPSRPMREAYPGHAATQLCNWPAAPALPAARPEALQAAGAHRGAATAYPGAPLLSTTPMKPQEPPSKVANWMEMATAVAMPMAHMLSYAYSPYDPAQMVEMLQAAMPDHYDE